MDAYPAIICTNLIQGKIRKKMVNLFSMENPDKGYQVVFNGDAGAVVSGSDAAIPALALSCLRLLSSVAASACSTVSILA